MKFGIKRENGPNLQWSQSSGDNCIPARLTFGVKAILRASLSVFDLKLSGIGAVHIHQRYALLTSCLVTCCHQSLEWTDRFLTVQIIPTRSASIIYLYKKWKNGKNERILLLTLNSL